MLRKTTCFTILFSVLLFGKLQAQKDSLKYKDYDLSSGYFINYLGFIKPNFAVVPCSGGIFVPNWRAWYLKTKDTVLSVEASVLDTSLLMTRTSKNIYEVIKVSTDTLRKKTTTLVLTRGFVFYAVPSNYIKGLNFYVVGFHDKFNICKLYNRKVDTVFHSDKMIEQLEVLNESTILFCYDNKLVIYPLAGNPTVIFDADKYKIQGFATDGEGSIYVSLDAGIIKIDRNKQQSFLKTDPIKGKLRYCNNELYVLDAAYKKLIVLPLISAKFVPLASSLKVSNEHTNTVKISDTLSNSDIITMKNAKLSDDMIIDRINTSEVNFNVSIDAMISLSGQNVSSAVIMAMKNAMKRKNCTIINGKNH